MNVPPTYFQGHVNYVLGVWEAGSGGFAWESIVNVLFGGLPNITFDCEF